MADESSPLGGFGMGTSAAIDHVAKTVAKITSDLEAMATSAEKFAESMERAAKAMANAAQVNLNQAGVGSGNTGQAQGTGSSDSLAPVSQPKSGFEKTFGMTKGQAAFQMVGAVAKVPINMFNDYRVGANNALEYERSRLIAFGGTGDFTRFQGNMSQAMNQFNVQNRSVIERDLGTAYGQSYSAGFGGGTVGERMTANAVGGFHTMASAAGIDPNAVGGAMNSMYASKTYYKALATGVMTRNPVTGDMLSPEAIINQRVRQLSGNTPEEVERALMPGGGLRAELEQTYQDPALVEMIVSGIRASKRSGNELSEGDVSAYTESGFFGTDATQGKDSEAGRQQSEQNRLAEYSDRVTAGIENANEQLTKLNDWLTSQTADSFFGNLEQIGGNLDTFGKVLPDTTQGILNSLNNLASVLLSALALKMFGGRGGGGGGGGGPTPVPGGGRGGPGAPGGGRGPTGTGWGGKLGKVGRGLGYVGIAASVVDVGMNEYEAIQGENFEEDLGATDFAKSVGSRAATGALIGAPFGGWVGAGVGGAVGGLVGAIEGLTRELNDTDIDTSKPATGNESSSAQSEGMAEGKWIVEADQEANVHYGEMVLPNRIAQAVRDEVGKGKRKKSDGSIVNINLTIQRATEQEAIMFARKVKAVMDNDEELMSVGSGEF